MDSNFICSSCRCAHNDPADARLGHLVLCLDCALALEPEVSDAESRVEPLAA